MAARKPEERSEKKSEERSEKKSEERSERKSGKRPAPGAVTPTFKALAAAGVLAAAVIAVLVNVMVARFYKRWDWTAAGLYTLSPLTQQTLHALEEPVTVYVMLSSADPMTLSLRQLLEAIRLHRASPAIAGLRCAGPSDEAGLAIIEHRA